MPVLSFAKDIRPMFRSVDVNHMKGLGVKLDDYSFMSDPTANYHNAQAVEDRLRDQSMPPDKPWTPDEINRYAKWRSDGYHP